MTREITPEQLIQEIENFYQTLIHPDTDDPKFRSGLDLFCQMQDELDYSLALALIQDLNWRSGIWRYTENMNSKV